MIVPTGMRWRGIAMAAVCLCMVAGETEGGSPPGIRESDFCKSLEYAGVAVDEPGYHIWGTSPILGEDGKVHLFVARWPIKGKNSPRGFDAAWRHDSEIAHYIGDNPEGPFKFSDVALKGTGIDTWDKYAPCNPVVKKVDGQYVLLYTANPIGVTMGMGRHTSTQRIGMAIAPSLDGPWKRAGKDGKILDPSTDPKHWTYKAGNGVNNPAFLKGPDGRYYLYFKSEGARMGVAVAGKLEGPYIHQPKPLSSSKVRTEDGYAFIMDGAVHLLTTDNHGVNVRGGGLLWKSADGIAFDPVPKIGYQSPRTMLPKVERKNVRSYYGAGTFQRPQVLMQHGRPTHLYVPSGTNIIGSDGTLSYVMRVKPKRMGEAQKSKKAPAHPEIIKTGTIDILEHDGNCLISYSWGNQHGTEHLAVAEYHGTLTSFLEGWFPDSK